LNAGSVEDMLAALNHFLRPPLLMMRHESANDAAAVHILQEVDVEHPIVKLVTMDGGEQ
jgi:hypothetical protein